MIVTYLLPTVLAGKVPMQYRIEKRKKDFAGFQINDEVMAAANKGAIVQHCLPAHRGEETRQDAGSP